MKSPVLAFLAASICLSATAQAADLQRGKELFEQRCVMCHGPQGLGDGPVAATLPPETKPRNLQEAKFKAVTDDASMKKLLQTGGSGMNLSPLMPPQPDLNDADLDSVIAFVRSLKK